MASWLVLDWDNEQFHVLAAHSSGGGVAVTHAATFAHPETLNAGSAERVGAALRDFLTAQNIPAASVIVGLGRDRIFLKELHLPRVEMPHEEATMVRHQTSRELSEPIDHYAVDYSELPSSGTTERRVMTVAGRREIVAALQTMCQAAGLKLYAVTPKLFGAAQTLVRAIEPDPSPLKANQLNVVLTVGQRWAELSFFKGERLLQSQALANGPLLVGEIKRNLALFQAQHAIDMDVSGPDFLYVFGADETLRTSLKTGQPLVVRELNPLRPEPNLAPSTAAAGSFAGAVGLALLWSDATPKPVNLVQPKRTTPPISATRQRLVFYGAAAAVLVLCAIGAMAYLLSVRRATIRDLNAVSQSQTEELTRSAQERAELDAYKEWEQTSVRWLDELYDLTARFPHRQGFRITQINAANATMTNKRGAKEAYVGRITLAGVYPRDGNQSIYDLHTSMARDAHLRANVGSVGQLVFDMNIDVGMQPALRYDTVLSVPPRPPTPSPKRVIKYKEPEKKPPVEPDPDDPDGGNDS